LALPRVPHGVWQAVSGRWLFASAQALTLTLLSRMREITTLATELVIENVIENVSEVDKIILIV